jgi:hypothetical protein
MNQFMNFSDGGKYNRGDLHSDCAALHHTNHIFDSSIPIISKRKLYSSPCFPPHNFIGCGSIHYNSHFLSKQTWGQCCTDFHSGLCNQHDDAASPVGRSSYFHFHRGGTSPAGCVLK